MTQSSQRGPAATTAPPAAEELNARLDQLSGDHYLNRYILSWLSFGPETARRELAAALDAADRYERGLDEIRARSAS